MISDPRWMLLACGSLGQLAAVAALMAGPRRRLVWTRLTLVVGAAAILALAVLEQDPTLFGGQLAALGLGLALTLGRRPAGSDAEESRP